MRPAQIADLRRETVELFYHGFDNYMEIAFPEDEVHRPFGHPGYTAVQKTY